MLIVIVLFFNNTEKDVQNCDKSGPCMYCDFMGDEVETLVRPPWPPRLLRRTHRGSPFAREVHPP